MVSKDIQLPPWWRLILGFAIAPLIASTTLACIISLYAGLPNFLTRVAQIAWICALFGGYPATIVFGVPAYLVLRRRVAPSVINCSLVGAIIAATPWIILVMRSKATHAYSNNHFTVQDSVITWWGLLDFIILIAELSVLGAFTGTIFWIIIAYGLKKCA